MTKTDSHTLPKPRRQQLWSILQQQHQSGKWTACFCKSAVFLPDLSEVGRSRKDTGEKVRSEVRGRAVQLMTARTWWSNCLLVLPVAKVYPSKPFMISCASGRNLMVTPLWHPPNMKLCNPGSNYVLKLHPPDDEDPRISVKMRWCLKKKKGKNKAVGDLLPHCFCQHLMCCPHAVVDGYLEASTLKVILPQKSFTPMGELFEDWWRFWHSFWHHKLPTPSKCNKCSLHCFSSYVSAALCVI